MMRQLLTDVSPEAQLLIAKFAGAFTGAAISLVHILPKSKQEAAARFLTGLAAGVIFGLPVGFVLADHFDITQQLNRLEMAVMGASLASLSAWTVIGLCLRFLERRFSKKANINNDVEADK